MEDIGNELYTFSDRSERCLQRHNEQQQQGQKQQQQSRAKRRKISEEHIDGEECSICLENIAEKLTQQRCRFGILSSCSHCFCWTCIQRWRKMPKFAGKDNFVTCPVCRVRSVIIPSTVWIGKGSKKDKLLAEYKKTLSENCTTLECLFECRLGDECHYRRRFYGFCDWIIDNYVTVWFFIVFLAIVRIRAFFMRFWS